MLLTVFLPSTVLTGTQWIPLSRYPQGERVCPGNRLPCTFCPPIAALRIAKHSSAHRPLICWGWCPNAPFGKENRGCGHVGVGKFAAQVLGCQNTPTESTNSAVIGAGWENKQKRNSRKAQRGWFSSHLYTKGIALLQYGFLQKEVSQTAQPKAACSLDYFRLNTLQWICLNYGTGEKEKSKYS